MSAMKINLTPDQLDKVETELGYWEASGETTVHRRYSGRGMYGETCVGLVWDDPNAVPAFLYFLAEQLELHFLELIASLGGGSHDSMGLSTITYWRNLTVEPSDEDEEEGE